MIGFWLALGGIMAVLNYAAFENELDEEEHIRLACLSVIAWPIFLTAMILDGFTEDE